MKFLITGGAGFIGSNFCDYVVNEYKEDYFVCLDKLTYAGNINNIKHLLNKDNFKFVKGDITNKRVVDNLFKEENFDIVINFAAESHVDKSIKNSEVFIKTNVLGVQVLLDACKKYHIKRFHQVSTDEVYGDLEYASCDKFSEVSPLNPNNPYSASKASADLLVLAYNKTHNLGVTISRSCNNYGKNQHQEKLIARTISNILSNKKIPIYGDGNNIRDWLYVDDCVKAIDLIVRKGRDGEIYNISSHHESSNIEIVKKILKQLNKDERFIKFVKDRPRNDRKYSLDTSKIEKELDWKSKTSFEDGLSLTIDSYLKKD